MMPNIQAKGRAISGKNEKGVGEEEKILKKIVLVISVVSGIASQMLSIQPEEKGRGVVNDNYYTGLSLAVLFYSFRSSLA